MTTGSRRIGPIEVRWGRARYKYSVAGELFHSEWESGMDLSKFSVSLFGLSAELSETVGRSEGTTESIRTAVPILAMSAVVYFSDYQKSIPLLAPYLLLHGGFGLASGLRRVAPRTWTVVRYVGGTQAFHMVQPEDKSAEWEQFEMDLARAIREVNASA